MQKGRHKATFCKWSIREIIRDDFQWIEWALNYSDHFHCDIDAVIEERKKTIKRYHPDDVIPFGKYKGQTIRYIYENDANYLRWLMDRADDFVIELSELINPK